MENNNVNIKDKNQYIKDINAENMKKINNETFWDTKKPNKFNIINIFRNMEEENMYIKWINSLDDDKISESIIMHFKWYSKKSNRGKKSYMILNILTIVLTASIPVINATDLTNKPFLTSLLAAIVGIATGIESFRGYKLSWLRYGQTYENIKKEIRQAINMIGKYSEFAESKDQRNKKLLEEVEKLASNEVDSWMDFNLNNNTSAIKSNNN